MRSFYFPLVLTVGGTILYQVAQKSIPKTASPFVTMVLAYVVAIVVCGLFAVAFPADRPLFTTFRDTNWAVIALGIGIVAVEIGFLLIYRAGWNISIAPVSSGVLVACTSDIASGQPDSFCRVTI
ncbi:MAG TPA: hypothetical protein VFV34_28005 [Blastocatellia bacterium]|nr:hypothetical protein [Blastocatellia bacterium]